MQQTYYNRDVIDVSVDESAVNGFVTKVFGWMFVGLLVTCLSTVMIMVGMQASDAFAGFIYQLSRMSILLFIVEIFIVGFLAARVSKMNPSTAIVLYLVYAAINGFTVGLVSVMYVGGTGGGLSALGTAFGITAISFGVMAAYGMVTKSDLTRAGNLLKMGLFGVIIMSVVNIFLQSPTLNYAVCIIGLVVFLGLVAYDTKKIKSYYAQIATGGGMAGGAYAGGGLDQEALASNLSIVGALMLYLDFINIFMFVLRLISGGSSRR